MSKKRLLPPELTIYHVSALRQEWLGWLGKPSRSRRKAGTGSTAWPVDGSGVHEVDAAGVQLLLALAKSLAARDRTLTLANPSGPLTSACRALGAAPVLGLTDAAGAVT